MTVASGKSRQFCSVCKDWLDMEVVPTGEGDEDDGVVWYRCPQCQGFLPKLKGAEDAAPGPEKAEPAERTAPQTAATDEDLPWDSPAAMMADLRSNQDPSAAADDDDDVLLGVPEPSSLETAEPETAEPESTPGVDSASSPAGLDGACADASPDEETDLDEPSEDDASPGDEDHDAEPILEYAALLAEADVSAAVPYRPWETYEVGQCVTHLAWDDCGVVVAKEEMPGGRKAIKCYFEDAGVIRLIEQAPR